MTNSELAKLVYPGEDLLSNSCRGRLKLQLDKLDLDIEEEKMKPSPPKPKASRGTPKGRMSEFAPPSTVPVATTMNVSSSLKKSSIPKQRPPKGKFPTKKTNVNGRSI